jgi:cytochrome c-type biogenesis protein
MSTMQRFKKHFALVEKLLGAFLVLTGVLFLTDSMTLIAAWILEAFPGLAKIG